MTSPETELDPCGLPPPARRILGIALRHFFLYLGSWPRLVEMMYWPILDITMFGFVSLSIVRGFTNTEIVAGSFLGGLLLGEIFTRNVMAMLVVHMEEVWSRNLGHLFASPLRLRDYIGGMIVLSIFRSLVAVIPAYILTYYLFNFSILRFGWALPLYAGLLCLNGWWYGMLVVSLLFRFGLAAEWLGWMSTWFLMPFMAPYYPVTILPHAFQYFSWILPGTYVFESMKTQIATGVVQYDYLGISLALNLVYFVGAVYAFWSAFRSAKQSGGLLQVGE